MVQYLVNYVNSHPGSQSREVKPQALLAISRLTQRAASTLGLSQWETRPKIYKFYRECWQIGRIAILLPAFHVFSAVKFARELQQGIFLLAAT